MYKAINEVLGIQEESVVQKERKKNRQQYQRDAIAMHFETTMGGSEAHHDDQLVDAVTVPGFDRYFPSESMDPWVAIHQRMVRTTKLSPTEPLKHVVLDESSSESDVSSASSEEERENSNGDDENAQPNTEEDTLVTKQEEEIATSPVKDRKARLLRAKKPKRRRKPVLELTERNSEPKNYVFHYRRWRNTVLLSFEPVNRSPNIAEDPSFIHYKSVWEQLVESGYADDVSLSGVSEGNIPMDSASELFAEYLIQPSEPISENGEETKTGERTKEENSDKVISRLGRFRRRLRWLVSGHYTKKSTESIPTSNETTSEIMYEEVSELVPLTTIDINVDASIHQL